MFTKSDLNSFSLNELQENCYRLSQALDDLDYCLETLSQESDELRSTNEMYKQTLSLLTPLPKPSFLSSSKLFLKTSSSLIDRNLSRLHASSSSILQSISPKYSLNFLKPLDSYPAFQSLKSLTPTFFSTTAKKTESLPAPIKKSTFLSPRKFVMSKLNRLE